MKKELFTYLFTLTILFFYSVSSVWSQEYNRNAMQSGGKGIIYGKIIDSRTKKPVEYASIAVFKMHDSTLVTGAMADGSGYFKIENVPFGMYKVVVKFVGYERKIINRVAVRPGNITVNLGSIAIDETAINLKEVEIQAEKKVVEYKIDRKVVNVSKDIVAAGGTAVEVLENTPSIETDVNGNVTLRGSSSFQLLIDGKPTVIDPNEMLHQLPAESIEKIEIITNPSAKYDPEGVGGIINVVMKKNISSGIGGMLSISYGSFNNYNSSLLLNSRTGKFNFFINALANNRNHVGTMNMNRKSFFNDTTYFMDVFSDNNRAHKGYNFKAGFDYEITPITTLTVSGTYGQRAFHFNMFSNYYEYTNPSTLDEYYYRENINENASNYFSGQVYLLHQFDGMDHNISASLFVTGDHGKDFETTDEYVTDSEWNRIDVSPVREKSVQNDDHIEMEAKVDYTKVFTDKGKLESGLELNLDNGQGDFKYHRFDTSQLEWVELEKLFNSTDFKRNIYSAYSTFSTQLAGFEFMAGIRVELTDRNIISHVMNQEYPINRWDYFPSFHLSRKLFKQQQIQFSYSRRIHRPREWYLDPYPDYIDPENIRIGNPALEPEYINSFELNYQKRIKSAFFSIEGYYREKVNKIERIRRLDSNNIMYHTFDNVDRDFATGVELMLNYDITKWWTLNLNGTIFNYKIQGELLETEVNQTMNTWRLRASNTFKLKGDLRIQMDANYRAPSVTAQGKREAMLFTNLGLRKDFFNRQLSLALQVRDVLNTMTFEFTSEGTNFSTYNKWDSKSPVINFSLTYRINNYMPKRRMNGNGGEDFESEETIF